MKAKRNQTNRQAVLKLKHEKSVGINKRQLLCSGLLILFSVFSFNLVIAQEEMSTEEYKPFSSGDILKICTYVTDLSCILELYSLQI